MSRIGDNGGPPLDWSDYGGFIAEARASRDHPIIGYGKQVTPADDSRGFCYSVNEAWRDLLHECKYQDGRVMNGGRMMDIRRGELVGAISWLAYRWNWTPKTVRRFLDRLEADGQISRFMAGPDGSRIGTERGNHGGKQAAIISVCNYDKFNPLSTWEGQASGQAEGKQGASKGQAEGKRLNKETKKQEDIYAANAADAQPVEDRKAINRAAARQAFAAWQDMARICGLPVPRDSSFDVYGQAIAARMYEHADAPKGEADMLAVWRQALANVERSSFLRGMTQAQFRADLKFLCQRQSFDKLLSGGYGNGAHATGTSSIISDEIRKMRAMAGDGPRVIGPREDAV